MESFTFRLDFGRYRWNAERDAMEFYGEAGGRDRLFLISNEALAEMLNPDRGLLSPALATEVFVEYEADIHRIAARSYKRAAPHDPDEILIRREDVR